MQQIVFLLIPSSLRNLVQARNVTRTRDSAVKTTTPAVRTRPTDSVMTYWKRLSNLVASQPALIPAFCLTGAGACLVWSFRFLPLHDLPIWMYEVHILRELGHPGSEMSNYFSISHLPVPNLGILGPLWLLSLAVPIEIAAKIYLSLCVVVFPWSFMYGVRSVSGSNTPLAYLGFPYILNLFVFRSQGYLLGLIMLFLCVGYFVPRLDSMTRAGWANLLLCLLVLYFVHAIAWFLLLLVLFGTQFRAGRSRGRLLRRLLLVALPTIGLFAWYFLVGRGSEEVPSEWRLYSIAQNVLKPMGLVVKSYGISSQVPITLINVGWFALVAILFLSLFRAAGFRAVRRSSFFLPAAVCLMLAVILGGTAFDIVEPGARFVLPAFFLTILVVGNIPVRGLWLPTFLIVSAVVCVYNWSYFKEVDIQGRELLTDVDSTTRPSDPMYVIPLDWPAGTGLMDMGSASFNFLSLVPYYRWMNDGGVAWIHGTSLLHLRPEWNSYRPQIRGSTRSEYVQSLKDHIGGMGFFRHIVVLGSNDESRQATDLFLRRGCERVEVRPLWTILSCTPFP